MPLSKSYNRLLDEHLHILIAQGNHEAFLKLARRYRDYSVALTKETLETYTNTGVSFSDVMTVCSDHFIYVVKKYDASQCSFYAFWKESTSQAIMDYLIDNSYQANAKMFKGFINLDEDLGERKLFTEQLNEYDDNGYLEKAIREVRAIIKQNKDVFKKKEIAILHLILEGYSINELTHSGLLNRSALYLTFNNACEKLRKIIEGKSKNS